MRTFPRISISALLFVASLTGCGMSQKEHQKFMDEQKAAMDAEMKKMQAKCDDDLAKKNAAIKQFEATVSSLGGSLSEAEAVASSLKSELGQTSQQLASTQKTLQATSEEVERLRKQREQVQKMAQAFRNLALKLKSMVDAGKLSVSVRKGRMTLNLPDDILFPSGTANLKKEGQEAIKSLAGVLKDVGDRDFLVAGHTDNIPVSKSGQFKSNWDLSAARAVTVVKLLTENGIDSKRVAAAGYADNDPIASNDDKEGRQKNRRTEIILMPNIEELPVVPESLE
jgi:chemotaxis protein MotB